MIFIPTSARTRDPVVCDSPHTLAFPMLGKYNATLPGTGLMTFYPFELPLTQLVEWWYRVRTWQLDMTFSSIWGARSFTLTSASTTESDRAKPAHHTWTASFADATDTFDITLYILPPYETQIDGSIVYPPPLTGFSYYINKGVGLASRITAPVVVLTMRATHVGAPLAVPDSVIATYDMSDYDADPVYDYSEHVGAIDGVPWKLGFATADLGLTMADIDWTLEPVGYWGWDGTWDTSTGARL